MVRVAAGAGEEIFSPGTRNATLLERVDPQDERKRPKGKRIHAHSLPSPPNLGKRHDLVALQLEIRATVSRGCGSTSSNRKPPQRVADP